MSYKFSECYLVCEKSAEYPVVWVGLDLWAEYGPPIYSPTVLLLVLVPPEECYGFEHGCKIRVRTRDTVPLESREL